MPFLKGMDGSSFPSPSYGARAKIQKEEHNPREYEGRLVSLKWLVHLRELEAVAAFKLATL